MIKSLDQMVSRVVDTGRRFRIAVAWAQDPNSLGALNRAVESGFIEGFLFGKKEVIVSECSQLGIDPGKFEITDVRDEDEASSVAVEMVKSGHADILMKGLVGTDKFLKAVIDRENGLMLPGATMSYVCAVQVPGYPKLLFLTDTAVLPYPDLNQKVEMATAAIRMARKFGIERPRVALIGASEKMSKHFHNSVDYAVMCKMAHRGQIKNCIMDGPLDLFLACDPASVKIKQIETPVNGEADILLFPSLESSNPFYKGLMLFGRGELAGILTGTSKPVVMMSRSESENSKFYCIALACLMADSSN